MSSMIFLNFLLLLLLPQVSSEEAEPLFRAVDSNIELGYCFGADYIVVYRSGAEGDVLLGNSSANVTPPVDLQGRVTINNDKHLLGLQISELTHRDSGMYRRECWEHDKLVSKQVQELTVCDEEHSSVELTVNEEGEMTELLCSHTSTGQDRNIFHWYREMFPSYTPTLFLDSSLSLKPLLDDLQGMVEVRDGGALLLLHNSVFKNSHHFFCLAMREDACLSFQNMFLPGTSENRDIFFSLGERLVLRCPSEGANQLWETPLGRLNATNKQNKLMSISFGEKSKDFSLVIPAALDAHSGDYSCISSTLEVQFLLVLCPKQNTEKIHFNVSTDVTMNCNVTKDGSKQVQWYRYDESGDQQLIHDSQDNMVLIPEDLDGRLVVSENGSLLSIANLLERDEGPYWCVVLGVNNLIEDDTDYPDDYDNDYTVDDVLGEVQEWSDPQRCFSKQEFYIVLYQRRDGWGIDPPQDSILPVVIGVIVAVLVLIAISLGVVLVVKKRRETSLKPKDEACHSPLNTTEAANVTKEPTSNDRLTEGDENVA